MISADSNDDLSLLNEADILVTGGSGLVGTELIKQLLAQGKKIKAIYNNTPLADFNNENVVAIKCDILDLVTLQEITNGIKYVYHCAAIVSFKAKERNKIFSINVEGTTNVVNAALCASVKKFVHVSSVAAIGIFTDGQHVTEEMNWTDETDFNNYRKSKFLAEMEVWRAIGEGLSAVIVNPSVILGGADWNRSSTEIFKTAYNEFAWYSEGITGFVDVRDVVKAMILLMESDISSERFILNAENISFKEIFSSIAKAFGKKPPHKKVTPLLSEIVWRLEEVKSFITGKDHLLTRETARTAISKIYFDNTKIKKYLPGFNFINIEQTINEACATLKRLNHL